MCKLLKLLKEKTVFRGLIIVFWGLFGRGLFWGLIIDFWGLFGGVYFGQK